MATFLAAMLVFAAAFSGLSIGVILSNRCIKGTCGGLNNASGGGESVCSVCASSNSDPASDAKKLGEPGV